METETKEIEEEDFEELEEANSEKEKCQNDEKTKERRRDTPSSRTALLEGEEKMEFF